MGRLPGQEVQHQQEAGTQAAQTGIRTKPVEQEDR